MKSYGSANLEQHVPVSNESVFRVGSVTKQFTAVALLLLHAEEGKLSLQDKLSKYYASFPRADDFEPGTNWSYSNSAYFILGGVVEKVAGEPLAAVFKTRLFVLRI